MRLLAGLATFFLCTAVHAAQTYKITALEFGSGLNNSGEVVGSYDNGDGTYTLKLYSGGTIQNLGTTTKYGGGDINNLGEITYKSANSADWQRASYSGGTLTHIETYAGSSVLSSINGVNDLGQAVGTKFPGSDPYLLENGTITFLGNADGLSGDSRVEAINNSGVAVGGNQQLDCCGYDAVVYENGGATSIGSLAGNDFAYAFGINDAGVIVGQSGGGGSFTKAVMYEDGEVTVLGQLGGFTRALAINNPGAVVGYSEVYDGGYTHRAFVYVDGQMWDLTQLAADLKGFVRLSTATAINDSGQILGTGVRADGSTGYFLATVVPLPPAVWLFGSAIAWLGWRRRR